MWRILDRVEKRKATFSDIELLSDVTKQIEGHTICAFGEAASWPTESFVEKFRDELVADTNPKLEEAFVNAESLTAAVNLK